MPRIISFGEALTDAFAAPGLLLREAKTLHTRPGGEPANGAVALARLGSEVGFIGKVGADEYGDFLIDLLAKEGVDVTHFVADPGGPTMLAIVAAPSVDDQNFIIYHGADALLRSNELPQTFIESAVVFVFGSVTLTAESRAATVQAARWAKEAGNQVIFDVNLRPLLWPDLETVRRRIQEMVECAIVVKVNEVELEFVTGTADPEQGSGQLLSRGIRLCCVSLGADGAYFNNVKASGQVPAFEVDALDTTGSGDAFVAGLAHGLIELREPVENVDESTLHRMVTFANACGGLASTRVGAMKFVARPCRS